MTTKAQYIELVQELVSGSPITADQKNSFLPPVIERYIEAAIKSIAGDYVRESEQTGDYSWLDPMCKWFDIPVKSNCGIYEGYLPDGLVYLDAHMGIRHVGLDKTFNRPVTPISSGMAGAIFSELDVAYADPVPSYYITGNKVCITGAVLDKCHLFALPTFSSLQNYEEVIFPKGNDTAVFRVISEKILQNAQAPSEKYNDGKPDRP